jgi:hypothetical protein
MKINHKKIRREDTDWIRVTQVGGQWRDLVNMVVNLRFHKRRGIY